MVGAVAEVVEPAFRIGEETAGSGAHAIAVGAFDDTWCGRESSASDGVVLGSGPKAEDNEIGLLGLPPEWIADVLLGNPENRRDGRFRISDFGMRKGIWGGTWRPYFVLQLRDFEGLLPRVITFVRYCGSSTRIGR